MRYKSAVETHHTTQRPPIHSGAAVTTADFDLLTLRLLKQALRQLFCKICLPRGGVKEGDGRGEGERERVKVCMRVLTMLE